jgi:hypothetical protein
LNKTRKQFGQVRVLDMLRKNVEQDAPFLNRRPPRSDHLLFARERRSREQPTQDLIDLRGSALHGVSV